MSNILRKKIVTDYLEDLLGYNQAQLYADGYEDRQPRVMEFFGLRYGRPQKSTFDFIAMRMISLYEKYEISKRSSLHPDTIRSQFQERLIEKHLDELLNFGEVGLYVDNMNLRNLYKQA